MLVEMFNLDQAIAAWRRQMGAGGVRDPQVLDELESHLRAETEGLIRSGKLEAEALEIALSRLGSVAKLSNEFSRVRPPPLRHWGPVKAAFSTSVFGAVLLCALLLPRVPQGKLSLLLASHILSVTLAYGNMFILGALGICYACVRLFRDLGVAERYSLRRASLWLAGTAAGLTGIGMVLGMVWSEQNWGRYWAWDPKEIGACLVLLWAAMITGMRWLPSARLGTMLSLAIGGNIVTGWAWFGTATTGPQAYGLSSRS